MFQKSLVLYFKTTLLNQITIKNSSIELVVLDFGAIIQKIIIKDKNGKPINVVVDLEKPEDYLNDKMYLGACIGRYAGRISNGGFTLKNKKYAIKESNNVHLHGGEIGFNQKYFIIDEVNHGEEPFIRLSYLSKDLEEGYPGNLTVTVTYTLIGESLKITHQAITDKTTVVNLTNHSYFKLDETNTVAHYDLNLNCSQITETYNNLLPTGNFLPVADGKYDFRKKRKIGSPFLDTPFAIDSIKEIASEVYSEISGIKLQVKTNQPALIIYTPPTTGSICFETQNFPDAPNQTNFPSSVLNPNEVYLNESIFTFTT